MKIAHKLYSLIAIGFFGCLLIGGTSLIKLTKMNENISYITAYFGLSGHLFRFHPARRFGVIRPA